MEKRVFNKKTIICIATLLITIVLTSCSQDSIESQDSEVQNNVLLENSISKIDNQKLLNVSVKKY